MPITRIYRKAEEPTASIPLYLCQQTQEALPDMWGRLPVEAMREELRQDIEARDRFEYLVSDEAGNVVAMMIIALDYTPHYGSYLAPLYAFSTEKGALSGAWRWMKQLAKCLKCDCYLITRQTGDSEITTRKVKVK
ncbi:hypothetical protein FBR42_13780 [Salmonella enterica subsp. enterica serovar Hull]|nr:hypothetical protein [Salmonella enterica subsp. enterica serovar Virchow]ECG7219813.1 hypothetical protein [Salmonella enterica subsp. enterica serovar Hull]